MTEPKQPNSDSDSDSDDESSESSNPPPPSTSDTPAPPPPSSTGGGDAGEEETRAPEEKEDDASKREEEGEPEQEQNEPEPETEDPVGDLMTSLLGEAGGDGHGQTLTEYEAAALFGGDIDHIKLQEARVAARQHAQDLLAAPRSRAIIPGLTGGRLGQLHRTATDGMIFNRRGRRTGTDTAVAVLLDSSSSMDSTLRQVSAIAQGMVEGLIRARDQVVTKAWTFNTRVHEVPLNRIAEIQTTGSTSTHLALADAEKWLDKRSELRKIILLFTDGEPDHPSLAREAGERLHKKRVRIVAGGMGSFEASRIREHLPYAITYSMGSDFLGGFKRAVREVHRITGNL